MDAVIQSFILIIITIVAVGLTLLWSLRSSMGMEVEPRPTYTRRKPLFKTREESLNINCRHCGADSWHGTTCSYCKLKREEKQRFKSQDYLEQDISITRQKLAEIGSVGVYLCGDNKKIKTENTTIFNEWVAR